MTNADCTRKCHMSHFRGHKTPSNQAQNGDWAISTKGLNPMFRDVEFKNPLVKTKSLLHACEYQSGEPKHRMSGL